MKNYVNEIFTRSYNIEQKINTGGQGAIQGSDSDVRAKLDGITNEIRQIRSSQSGSGALGGGTGSPDQHCVSSTLFIIIILVQSAILSFVFVR